ncbi:MAG: hypothetical protein IKH15_11335 [Bacteroidales bacterium]|nr:hypothetical protein [Bacteroidales bacterium]MBR4647740.1 hypothetical protein [Bacteroidales bacterium]MBR6904656.1 hypothetical protein [Bacteroidales bacterium]
MGGRGAFQDYKAAARSGFIILAGIFKSDFGKKRDTVLSNVKSQFKEPVNKTIVTADGKKRKIEVGTNSDSRTHLAFNIVDRKAMNSDDASKLRSLFKNSSFVNDSPLKHERDDNYEHFYYFKAQRRNLYFHVGEGVSKSGAKYYRLYAITKTL